MLIEFIFMFCAYVYLYLADALIQSEVQSKNTILKQTTRLKNIHNNIICITYSTFIIIIIIIINTVDLALV